MFSGLDRYERYGPLLLRLGIGVTMLLSGYGKVIGLAGVTRFWRHRHPHAGPDGAPGCWRWTGF